FGVAKATGRAHETRVAGIMKGKVPYLSPEQLTGLKVDRRSDLFSLGILMYVMVSGRHPFRGESDARTMENICTRAAVPLRDLVPDVRPDLEEIVMRALEKDANSRWSTAGEMQRALEKVIMASGEPVTDSDVGAFVRLALGELIIERNQQLQEAIQRMDTRAASDMPAPGKTRLSARRAVKGGAPLPATFDGIIPLDLPDAGAEASASEPPRSAPPRSLAPLPSFAPSHRPRAASLAPPPEPPREARGRMLPYFGVGVLAVLTAAALGVRSGHLPWLADRIPGSLAFLTPPGTRPADGPAPLPLLPSGILRRSRRRLSAAAAHAGRARHAGQLGAVGAAVRHAHRRAGACQDHRRRCGHPPGQGPAAEEAEAEAHRRAFGTGADRSARRGSRPDRDTRRGADEHAQRPDPGAEEERRAVQPRRPVSAAQRP
ncbi:MAG: protein kinase, partial [Polyangiaceae bacterium]